MDLDLPLLIVALASALLLAARALRSRPVAWDWLAVVALVLGGAAAGWFFSREHVGLAAFGVWALLGWGPAGLGRAITACHMQLRYGLAARFAWAVYILHPSRAYLDQARRCQVAAFEQAGHVDLAIAELDRILADRSDEGAKSADGPLIALARLRLEQRWPELEEQLEALPDAVLVSQPPSLVQILRLELDLGRRARAFALYTRLERLILPGPFVIARNWARLTILALGGRRGEVDRLLEMQLAGFSAAARELWSATAALCAGDPTAYGRLRALTEDRDPIVRGTALARLRAAERLAADELTPEHLRLLDRVERALDLERRYQLGSATPSRLPATWAIALCIGAVFVVEVLAGGSTDTAVLDRLGALEPYAVLRHGEWYRLVTFLFLHYGAVHLGFNVLGLAVLAPFVERSLGKLRFVAVYLASGLVGGLLVVAQAAWLDAPPSALVGASGCIMGLAGAAGAVLLRGYRRERLPIARRRFLMLVALVVLQTVSDLIIPQVSLFAHAVGAITGFVLTLFLSSGPPATVRAGS